MTMKLGKGGQNEGAYTGPKVSSPIAYDNNGKNKLSDVHENFDMSKKNCNMRRGTKPQSHSVPGPSTRG